MIGVSESYFFRVSISINPQKIGTHIHTFTGAVFSGGGAEGSVLSTGPRVYDSSARNGPFPR